MIQSHYILRKKTFEVAIFRPACRQNIRVPKNIILFTLTYYSQIWLSPLVPSPPTTQN
jgi:hypothetical protein